MTSKIPEESIPSQADYLVLRLDNDTYARAAAALYADLIEAISPDQAYELRRRIALHTEPKICPVCQRPYIEVKATKGGGLDFIHERHGTSTDLCHEQIRSRRAT